ncbi:MAG: DUF4147 domain-containing protein [Thaumarchaeota archaeon]|nr:DUF4147 domain-containing protein [Nitrososphaerota archaeon]
MIIRNFKQLATSRDKRLALSIIEKGLEASMPHTVLKKIVKRDLLQLGHKKLLFKKYSEVYLVAIGKSSDLMAKVVSTCTHISGGIVVMPSKAPPMVDSKKFTIIQSSHPIPTRKSLVAARAILHFLESLDATALVVFLISGGSSSLVSLPDGISLEDKQHVNDLLLKSGANIREINCLRKHLSKIKGGRILESLNCEAVSLVMSDVIGDDLSVIASGLTYCDLSTFSDAKKILLKYDLKNKMPRSVWSRIILGAQGKIPETPKRPRIKNLVILSNKDCVDAMKKHARSLGFETKKIWPLDGDVNDASSKISKHFPIKKNSCLVFGGETTVHVKGKGQGGRNQELVLNFLKKFNNDKQEMVAVSVGTDGIDGNASAAGAIADSNMPSKQIRRYLSNNNSFCYFKKYGGAIFTGPTHTNLMDIGLVLRK